jgi:hypothetical protein
LFQKSSEIPFQQNELENLFHQNYLYSTELEKHILFATPHIHCIPTSFEPQENMLYFDVMFNNKELKKLLNKSLWNIYINYGIENKIYETANKLNNSKFYPHLHSLMLQTKYIQHKNKNQNLISVHIFKNYIEIICLKEQQPYLINTYNYQNNNDIMYYIQYIIQILKLQTDNILLFFSGKIEKNDELFDLCKKFQLSYQLTNFNNQYIYSYRFNELKPHQFSTLFFLPYENY